MGASEVRDYLTHSAVGRGVAASTRNQALSAPLFLYREVLGLKLDWVEDVVRAKKSTRLPVVFTRDEVRAVLLRLEGTKWLMASPPLRRRAAADGVREAERQGRGL